MDEEYLNQVEEYFKEAVSKMPSHYKLTYETDNTIWSLGENGEIIYSPVEKPK